RVRHARDPGVAGGASAGAPMSGAMWCSATVACALLATLGACRFTPPALLEAPTIDVSKARAELSPPGEDVDLALEDGAHLRGFFVEADPGAPVVLHLLESS